MPFSQQDGLLALLQAVNTALIGHTVQRQSEEAIRTEEELMPLELNIST